MPAGAATSIRFQVCTGGKDRLSGLMALAVDQLPLGQIGTNCYLVRASREATDAVVIDPGAEASEIRLSLARRGASCAGILLTHSHYDHLGALAELAEGTGAPVWLPEGEKDVFERPNDFYGGFGVTSPRLHRRRARCSPAARPSTSRASRSR